VAGCVVDGIRAERFVILTHDHFAQDLAARTEALVTGALPAIPDFL
jgi:hypothetical protein